MADKSDIDLSSGRITDVQRRSFNSNQFIFREHEKGDQAFVISEGRVEILKESPEGPRSLRVLEKGAMFGEMALIDDQPRMASAKAVDGPVELLEIDKKMFKTLQRKIILISREMD